MSVPLCKDCKHFHRSWWGLEFSRCDASIRQSQNHIHLLTGKIPKGARAWADVSRTYGPCGPEGKLYEPT